ncbi:methyltransferase domain-containing protein [Gynuella sp.]|uniref:methyltransferase domain-containing protein n=1 Tax=Gynuella sp. TaxID=2969146 RepID=UPI003D0A8410
MVSILAKPLKKISALAKMKPALREALMHHWFDSDLGQELLKVERKCLDNIFKNKLGHHLIQIDSGLYSPLLSNPPIGCCTLYTRQENRAPCPLVRGVPEQLPFKPDSIDHIILHHTLDFCEAPYQTVREASIALMPNGHLVVVGFNPASLWLARKFRGTLISQVPWIGRFIRAGRVAEWLELLNLEVVEQYSLMHRPAFNRASTLRRFNWFDRAFRVLLPRAGAVYILVAQKRVAGLIHRNLEWLPQASPKSPITAPEINSPKDV